MYIITIVRLTLILFVGLQFQLLLSGVEACSEGIHTDKLEEVAHLIVLALGEQCQCDLTASHITDEELICLPEMEKTAILSARLSQTKQASTTDIISHINEWILNGSTFFVTLEENETSTEITLERILTPSCTEDSGITTPSPEIPSAASTMLNASEIAMWTAITLLLCAVLAITILLITVFKLRQKLTRERLHSRFVKDNIWLEKYCHHNYCVML